jgi:hypothetical protein
MTDELPAETERAPCGACNGAGEHPTADGIGTMCDVCLGTGLTKTSLAPPGELTAEAIEELERATATYLRILDAERSSSRAEEPLLSVGIRLVQAFDKYGGEHRVILTLLASHRQNAERGERIRELEKEIAECRRALAESPNANPLEKLGVQVRR